MDQYVCIFITLSDIPMPYSLFCLHLHIYGEERKLFFFFKLLKFFLILVACSSRDAFDERCNIDF